MLLRFPKRRRRGHGLASLNSGKKSSAVTAPSVAALMRTSTGISGNLSPAAYLLTAAGDTRIARAKSAGVVLDFAKYSDRRMLSVTSAATDGQAPRYRRGSRQWTPPPAIIAAMATTGVDHFRARLLAYQRASGRGWDDIARELGIARQTPYRWARGDRIPDPPQWPLIAALMECYTEELFLPPDIASLVRLWMTQQGRPRPQFPKKKVASTAT